MKRVISLITAILLLSALMLSGCGSDVSATDVPLADIRDEIIAAFPEKEPILINDDYLFILYGIESAAYTEAAAVMFTEDIFSDEAVMLKAADEESVKSVQVLLQQHLDSVAEQSREYDPESYAITQKSIVGSEGLYVWLFISAGQEQMQKIFASHLKKYPAAEAPVYTPAPTAEPTATEIPSESVEVPVEEADAEPLSDVEPLPYGLVPESARADDSYWDNVLFFGNSVAKNIENYTIKMRMSTAPSCMGKAEFLTVGSFQYAHAATHTGPKPLYQGKYRSLEEAAAQVNADKLYIMLGHGDMIFGDRETDDIIADVETTLSLIRGKDSDVVIYLLAMTPRSVQFEDASTNSTAILAYNEALCACAERNGCYYINAFEALADQAGCLPEDYCSEHKDGIHLTDEGCAALIDYLYTHTAP